MSMSNKLTKRVKLDRETTIDKIMASFFNDKIELTPKQKEKKRRMETAFSHMRLMLSIQQTAKRLREEFGVSEATAYRDIKDATTIFGDIHDVNARGVRIVLREAYWRAYQLALKAEDIELQIKALDKYKELFDWDDDMTNEELKDKIQAHVYNIKISRDTAKALKKQLNTGVIDFNDFGAEYADFEELPNDSDEETN